MKNIPFGKPIIKQEEKDAVMKVMDGDILVHGPSAKEFEDNLQNLQTLMRLVFPLVRLECI